MAKTGASFTDILLQDNRRGRKCDLAYALERMDPSMSDQLCSAMANPTVSAAAISRTLGRFNFPISEGSVRRCRRICSCWHGKE